MRLQEGFREVEIVLDYLGEPTGKIAGVLNRRKQRMIPLQRMRRDRVRSEDTRLWAYRWGRGQEPRSAAPGAGRGEKRDFP